MIKKHILITSLLISFTSYISVCQTLNASDVTPILGDKYIVNSLNHAFDTLQTGASVTWDYSSLTPDNIDTFIAQSTIGSVFPNTDIRFVNPQTGTSHYFNTDATYLEYAGKDDNGSITTYPNPDRILTFPMILNTTFIDSVHMAPLSSVMLKIGYVENKLDGFGTLILPSGTFTNAFRVKSSYYLKDSSIGAPSSNPFYYVRLRWYIPGIHYPIASTMGYGNLVTPVFEFLSNFPTSINEIENNIVKVYPNPCTNLLKIEMTSESTVSVEIVSFFGSKLFAKQFNNENPISIDCSKFKKGIYILKVQDQKCSYERRLVIE